MAVLECPICHKTVTYAALEEVPYRPFCSQRCKLVDLGRWLNEEYRISEEIPDAMHPASARPENADDE